MSNIKVLFAAFFGGPCDGLVIQVEGVNDELSMAESEGMPESVYKVRHASDDKLFVIEQSKHVSIFMYDYDAEETRKSREQAATEG